MNHALASALAVVTLASASRAGAAPPGPATGLDDRQLFSQLCASCHGPEGRGNGPVAPSLKISPPDLTAISARNGGSFPAGQVRDMIDGRAALPVHGTREMPVWGYELEARAPADAPGRASAAAMTDRLVEFLRSLQK